MRFLKSWYVAVLMVFIVIVFAIRISSIDLGLLPNAFAALRSTPSASVWSSRTIVQGIQPLGRLVNMRLNLAKVEIRVNVEQGALGSCNYGSNHVAQGVIEAGIDLGLIEAENISYDIATNTYNLTIPSPQLTSCHVDYIRQYDRSTTVCPVDWDALRLIATYEALIAFRDDAVQADILGQAEQQSALVLGNFIHALTNSDVNISFVENATPVDISCQPELPNGWQQDATTGAWSPS